MGAEEATDVDIASGRPESHPTPLPIDASATPGVQRPGFIQPGQLSGPTYPARDTTGEFQEQRVAGEADCRTAQAAGMAAEDRRRQHYAADVLPLGASYGDAMIFPASPLDPGAGVGNTAPTGAFYDPPREYGGEQGAPGYQGEAQ
jgi:hypothetical protein